MPRRLAASLSALVGRGGRRRMTTGVGRGLRFDPGPSNRAYATGGNEMPVQQALAAHLHAGGVFYDIGANVGFFTVIGAQLVGPSGHVYAFEPVPDNAGYIRRNCDLNKFSNVTVLEKAVSDNVGNGELILARYSGGAVLSTAPPPPDATASLAVDLTTIDDEVLHGRIEPPSVVKIDVEGVELEVLRGMVQTIRMYLPTIVCEVDDASREGFEQKYDACAGLVASMGYVVERLADSYPGDEWLVGHFTAVHSSRVVSR